MLRNIRQDLRRLYQFFRRPKATIFIITIVLVLFLIGLVVPQKGFYRSRAQFEQWNTDHPVLSFLISGLGLNEIYVAPITVFFLGLFFVNLLVVLIHRVPFVLRRSYIIDRRSTVAGMDRVKEDPQAFSIVVDEVPSLKEAGIAKTAASFFRRRFWFVMMSESGRSFVAVRNRFSPIGFIFFHISFIFCLVGGLLVMYTRFSGNLLLTEGEEFHSDIKQFRTIRNDPKIFHALPELGIKLLKVIPSYEGSVGTGLAVSMKVQYFSETVNAVTRVNEPFRKGAVSILPESTGISPLFILRKKGGEELQGGYFSLYVLKGQEDSFQLPDSPYVTYVQFYPDFAEEGGKPFTKSFEMRNPVFHLRIKEKGRVLYDGFRRVGEWAAFDGLELSCREIRHWADLLIVREYGTVPLFIGFFVGAIGLVMRLIFFQKTVRVHVEECGEVCTLYISGRSEYYQQMFREDLGRLILDLTSALKGSMAGGVIA